LENPVSWREEEGHTGGGEREKGKKRKKKSENFGVGLGEALQEREVSVPVGWP